MTKMPLTRRKKRLIFTVTGSTFFILLAAGVIWLTRPRPEPYRPGEKVEGITASLGRRLPGNYPRVHFTDVTQSAGIDFRHFYGQRSTQLPEDMGSGAAWGDYNNDGWLDLYVVNIAGALTLSPDKIDHSPASNRLYKNNGDGTLVDVTESAHVGGRDCGMGAAWGDYDNDSDLDLVVTNYGTNRLYRNDGNGIFTEVSQSAGIGGKAGFWTGASWADYDKDGNLDLYICGYVQYRFDPADLTRIFQQYEAVTPATLNPSSYSSVRNLLYHNNGDGTLTEVAQQAGVDNPSGRSLSASWGDYNNDGWADLYVANDVSDNVMYRNKADGTFTDVSHEAWVADYRGAMGLAIGDWDNDSDLDLFVTHWVAQENALYNNLLTEMSGLPSTQPPVSLGEISSPQGTGKQAQSRVHPLRFTDMADAYGLGQIALDYVGWGTAFFDYDNDGRLDLLTVNGSTLQQPDNPKHLTPMRDSLFWNNGEEGFFEVGAVSGDVFQEKWVGRGAAFADYDNDGDVDIFIVNHSARPKLLRNDGGNANHWLKVRLEGIQSNRWGIGARLTATIGEDHQTHEVGAGSSYLSQNAPEAIFGCGEATVIDSLRVDWPSGVNQELTLIPTKQIIKITEGKGWQAVQTSVTGQQTNELRNSQSKREQVRQFWETYRQATQTMKVEGNWEKATDLFREALSIDPNHEDSTYYLGNCLFELRDYSRALIQFQRLVEINPQSLRGNLQIGSIYACPDVGDLFDLDAAEQVLQRALAINPEESGSLLQLGTVVLAKGDLERASKYFSMVRQLNFKAVEAYYLDGYIQWKRGDTDTATTLFRQAIEYSHSQKPVHGVLGEGDTKRTDRGALTSAVVYQRRLFGEQIAELKEKDSNKVISNQNAVEEYQQFEQSLDRLKTLKSTVDN